MKTAVTLNLVSEKKKITTYISFFFLCLLCFMTIHLPPDRILQNCKGLWGDEVRSLDEALSVCVKAVWGPGKMKNRRARRLNFCSENGDLDSENI